MDAQNKTQLRMLYLSCARIPSEKAHAYQILKMCESFASQGITCYLTYGCSKQNTASHALPVLCPHPERESTCLPDSQNVRILCQPGHYCYTAPVSYTHLRTH